MLGINLKARWVKVVIWFTAAVFIGIFVFGAHMAFQERQMMVAININGEPVFRDNFFNMISSRMEDFRSRSDEEITDEDKIEIFNAVKDDIVLEYLLQQEAKNQNIFVSNFEIFEGIRSYFFTDENGVFNAEAFNYYRAEAPAEWWNLREEHIRDIIRTNKLQSNVIRHIKVTDDELLNYYQSLYKEAEVAQVLIKPANFVDHDKVFDYYNDNLDKYEKPERIKARHLLIADTEALLYDRNSQSYITINNIRNMIAEGYDFEKLILNFSQSPDAVRGGVINYFGYYDVEEEFASAAFDLNLFEISDIVATSRGFHIIQKIDIADVEYYDFDEVEEQIRMELVSDTEWDKAFEKINLVLEKIDEGETFESIAANYSHAPSSNHNGVLGSVIRTSIDFEYLSRFPDIFEEIPIEINRYNDYVFVQSITNVIFNLKPDEVSGIVDSDYGYHIFKSIEIVDADMEKFDELKREVKNRLLYRKQEQTLIDWQKSLLNDPKNRIEVLVKPEEIL